MGKTAESPPAALPALTAHFFRLVALVPHVPLPILPVVTLKVVNGSLPVLEIVAGIVFKNVAVRLAAGLGETLDDVDVVAGLKARARDLDLLAVVQAG